MGVVVTTIFAGRDTHISNVIMTSSADVAATVPHGLLGTPQEVTLTPLLAACWAGRVAATTINSTNVLLTKTTNALGLGLTAMVRVIVKRPHTLGR